MERLIIAVALVAVVALVAFAVGRWRGTDAPSQPKRWAVPAQLDRDDFVGGDHPWLAALFTSATCQSCARIEGIVAPLASQQVAVAVLPWQDNKALHDRYGIEAVPCFVLADEEGVVRYSVVGSAVTATDLWAGVAEARTPPPPELTGEADRQDHASPVSSGAGWVVTHQVHREGMESRLYARLTALAEPHAGYLSSWEADRVGVSERSMARARRDGLVVPVRRSVGRLAAAAVHPHEPIHAATLAIPTAVATRSSALCLHPGLPRLEGLRPQIVTVGHLAARCSGVEAHVTRRLDAEDITVVGGTATETFGRAVLSVIGDPRVHWTWVARVLDAGCRLWDDRALDDVQGAIERAGARGHSGVADLRLLVDERRAQGPRDRYALQRKVMRWLDDAGLHGQDEHHVVLEGRDRWIDRAFVDAMIAVEVKGWSVHGGRAALDDDADREAALVAAGWRVFPVTSRTDPVTLIDRLRRAVADSTASTAAA